MPKTRQALNLPQESVCIDPPAAQFLHCRDLTRDDVATLVHRRRPTAGSTHAWNHISRAAI
jgi:hypothetical protein